MSRTSRDEYDNQGNLLNGFDYDNQCWVVDGLVQRCGHPESMDCRCYGKLHQGERSQVSLWDDSEVVNP